MVTQLCKSRQPGLRCLRLRINEWFECLPESNKDKLEEKLRSQNDKDYFASFSELFFGAYLYRHFGEPNVAYEPNLNGMHPDWLFTDSEGLRIALEVTSFRDFDDRIAGEDREGILKTAIKPILKKRTCYVNLNEPLPKNWGSRKNIQILKTITKGAVDKTIVTSNVILETDRTVDLAPSGINGWMEIKPIGTSSSIYISGPLQKSSRYIEHFKDMIEQKLQKYSKTTKGKMPLIVGLLTFGSGATEWSIERALYGNRHVHFQLSGPEQPLDPYDARCGVFTKWKDEKPLNTSLSALVWCKKHRCWDDQFGLTARVYHNPFACTPLPRKTFINWPQFIETSRNRETVTMKWRTSNWHSV